MTGIGNDSMSSTPSEPELRPAGSGLPETLFAALTSALLFSLFLLLPLAGSAALAFAGVPLVRLAHRRGLGPGLAAAALSSGILAALGWTTGGAADAAAAAVLAAVSMALPVLFSGWVRGGAPASRAFLLLCAAGFAFLGGALLLREATVRRSVRTEIGAAFDAMAPSTAPDAAGKSPLDPETAVRMKATFTRFKEFAQAYWLGLVGASWVLAAGIAFFVGAWSARPVPSAELTRFEALRVPAPVVALFVAAGAGFALLPGPSRPWAGDLLLPLSALYFLTGLSIICHFARRWFRARILRAGLYALVVYFPLNVAVGLLGLFDWYADFRRRGEKA